MLQDVSPAGSTTHRVAFVSGSLPFGGTTTFCLFVGEALQRMGVAVKIFSFSRENPLGGEFAAAGIPVTLTDERMILEDRMTTIYEALRRFTPTSVFAVLSAESFEVLRYMPGGVVRVGMAHDHHPEVYDLARRYRSSVDHYWVGCDEVGRALAAEVPGTPLSKVLYGIRLNPNRKLRDPNPANPLRLLYFGRFQESQKRVRLFPVIYAALKKRQVPFRWTIHGSGPEEDYLRTHFATAIAAGEIVLSPPTGHDRLHTLIRQHDIYLLTSAHEGGPQTLLEAMAYGLVPICSDIPCLVSEVVRKENGFRVAVGDVEAYADAIAEMHLHRSRLEIMSAAAARLIGDEFTEEAMGRRFLGFLDRITPRQQSVHWPAAISPHPILGATGFKHHPALRPLKRLVKRLQVS